MKSTMLIVDAFAFCRNGEQQSGEIALPELTRLQAECVSDTPATLQWTLAGHGADGSDTSVAGAHARLHVTVSGTISLICQRCLSPFEFEIDSASTVIFAKDEKSADELDAMLEEDDVEVVVGSKSFDVMELIEDEALLAIPLSPKHEVCPDKEKLDAFVTAKKESPFAVLKIKS